jgi:hypothetical protein
VTSWQPQYVRAKLGEDAPSSCLVASGAYLLLAVVLYCRGKNRQEEEGQFHYLAETE